MVAQELDIFISEAERTLRSLRSQILVGQQSGVPVRIEPLSGSAKAISRSASELGSYRLLLVLEALEDELARASALGPELDNAASRSVLDLISHAEAEIVGRSLSQGADVFDPGTFVESSFQNLRARPAQENPPDAVDAELMEVFSQEAEELLGRMDVDLETLAASPSAEKALWELRRHAHTFKGAAGMVGLEDAARLAHRMEDLLDRLSEDSDPLTPKTLTLLSESVSELRSLTFGGAEARKSELPSLLDQLSSVLGKKDAVPQLGNTDLTGEGTGVSSNRPGHANVSVDDLRAQRKRPVVRVSIDRLDEVIKAFNEVSRAGTRLERAIADLGPVFDRLERIRLRMPPSNAAVSASVKTGEGPADEMTSTIHGVDVLPEFSEALSALEGLRDALDTCAVDQSHLLAETQRKLNKIRLIRFGSLATRLQRTLQVACDEEGDKQAELFIADPNVELDTDVLDALVEPIMHLIRNAVAHGIEPPETRRLIGKNESGAVTVRVRDKAAYVEISIEDDGRGIDLHALTEKAGNAGNSTAVEGAGEKDLIFLPGLTTAEKLTMNSGRGIGMSIVKESVESRGGSITFETTPAVGTTFTLRVPSGRAAIQVLIANCGAGIAAIPSKFVKEVIAVEPEDIHSGPKCDEIFVGGLGVPARYLSELLGAVRPARSYFEALILSSDDVGSVLLAGHILRTESVILEPAGSKFASTPGVLASAVLSSGEEVPVLDPSAAFLFATATETAPSTADVRVMVVDDSPSVRRATAKTAARAGFSVLTATGGVEALLLMENGPLPDLIVTDVEMPRMDGFRFAAAVRADHRLRHIPIVFITSRTETEFRQRADELGALDYLTKPFAEADLLGILDEVAAVRAGSLTLLGAC